MSNNSDEIAEGILKALWQVSIGLAAISLISRHPLIIGFAFALLAVCSLIYYAYSALREAFGSALDLIFSGLFAASAFYLWNLESQLSPVLSKIAVFSGWGLILLGIAFFKAFFRNFFGRDQ